MPIPLLLQTAFSLILSQSNIPADNQTQISVGTHFDIGGCKAYWLDRTGFEPVAHMELATIIPPGKDQHVTARVVCREHEATVLVYSTNDFQKFEPLKRTIFLHDTPAAMRTRTLALAVADAVKDFTDGLLSAQPLEAESSLSNQAEEIGTSVSATPSRYLKKAGDDSVHAYRPKRRTILELSVLSPLTEPHAAPSLRWALCIKKWRLGLQGAGMRFSTASGKVYTGEAAAHLGYTLFDFLTKKENVGELNLGGGLGVLHARGLAISPIISKTHTMPLAAIEADFMYYIKPLHRNTLGLRVFGGWMLGMSMNVKDEKIGGFNGFYAGAGVVGLLHGRTKKPK